ncbi:MAG: radical SAM protein [Oligoflexia bacterium]|nr:radical SAM protein [Oligoflexia bacterium]
MDTKVLLVIPNSAWTDIEEQARWRIFPYGLTLIAAVSRDICEIKIIDANIDNLSITDFEVALRAYGPDIVGISVLFDPISKAGHKIAEIVKKISKNITVVLGGVYATTNAEEAFLDKNIDYLVRGEGELVFKDLVKYLQGKENIPTKGIWYRNSGTVHKGELVLIEDLDALPLPAYDLIDIKKYLFTPDERKSVDAPFRLPFAYIITSRGCPLKCTFCQVATISGRNFRYRSPENIIAEIKWLKRNFNLKSIIFQDDNLLTNRQRAKNLFNMMIKNKLSMPWKMIATAVFMLDDEMILIMKRSGCKYVCIAIESGCVRILRNIINKPINFEHAKKMVNTLKSNKIFVAANFIIGFPTETWDETRETVSFAEKLKVDYVKLFTLIPLRGTKIWDLCEKMGYFKQGFKSENISWNTAQINSPHFSTHDLTILRAYEWDRINFSNNAKIRRTSKMMGVTENELLKIRQKTLLDVQKRIRDHI